MSVGVGGETFYQKHPGFWTPPQVRRFAVPGKEAGATGHPAAATPVQTVPRFLPMKGRYHSRMRAMSASKSSLHSSTGPRWMVFEG